MPVATITSGRPELAPSHPSLLPSLSTDQSILRVATPVSDRHTPFSTRPTRIGNQFRKTVINGTVRASGVRGPHRAACGNRAAFGIVSLFSLSLFSCDPWQSAFDFPPQVFSPPRAIYYSLFEMEIRVCGIIISRLRGIKGLR